MALSARAKPALPAPLPLRERATRVVHASGVRGAAVLEEKKESKWRGQSPRVGRVRRDLPAAPPAGLARVRA